MNQEERVMTEFTELFSKLVWLNKSKLEASLNEHQSSEVHCIEYIGKHTDPNVTRLASALYMTSGAISKIMKKLIRKGLVESYKKPDNKKEIYFRLTKQGADVYRIHEELHKEFRERDRAVFEQVTAEQFDGMLRFMESYGRHLDEEIRKQGLGTKAE